ncbi:hypothetical protein O0544_20710 [Edwardsiella anguillarum]|nr:hypothetical protein [Edwardsiella anguillarum]
MQIQQRYNHNIPKWPELVTFIRQHMTAGALTTASGATREPRHAGAGAPL